MTAGFALAAMLCGCGHVDVNGSSIRGMAYVRTDDVMKHHPLYPQLAKIEDAMTAIDLQAAGPRVPRSAAEVTAGVKALNAQLRDSQMRANATIAQTQSTYARKEREADAAALSAAGIDASGLNAAAGMNATSAVQAQSAAAAANQDYMAYQQSVVSQDSAAANAVAMQFQKQSQEKIRAKAEAFTQNETDLSLRLAQQDSQSRLALKMKLNNLALDPSSRSSLEQQIAGLDKKEAAQVNDLRDRDRRDLAAYAAQLRGETDASIRGAVGSIRARTQAKLTTRRDAVGAQIRSLSGPALPANIPPDVQKKLARIHVQFATQFQNDAQKTVTAYNAQKSDLDRQFAALQGQDVGATGAAAAELAQLQKRHDQLQGQITEQIRREAQRVAKDMGLRVVFENVAAAPGGYDLTNDLIHDVESMHE
ncbi:MAG: OmpH family outer membrane protein [Candidatus Eremiobacteraeota bacterium]|nr:OmpH family outer membrane protein [Candidatus Eremiobacteraeota bacterium]